jgi:hypothetical protein
MARKAAKAAPKLVEPEDESQEAPEGETETEEQDDEPAAGGKAMSKAEAIRRALAAGFEGPQEGTAYIRKEFGIEVAPQHFSATKSQLKSREGSKKPKGKPGRKPKAASQGVEGYLAPPQKPEPIGGSDLLDAMEVMKPLVASLGKEQVKRIVDLLG